MAVTVDSQYHTVFGNKRVINLQLDIATTGDTWQSPLRVVDQVLGPPAITTWSATGGVITFTISGTITNGIITIIGT